MLWVVRPELKCDRRSQGQANQMGWQASAGLQRRGQVGRHRANREPAGSRSRAAVAAQVNGQRAPLAGKRWDLQAPILPAGA